MSNAFFYYEKYPPVAIYRNKYYITSGGSRFYELTPDLKDRDIKGSRYFIRALRHMEATSNISGKIFIVVEMGDEELPAYGDNVIVFVVSDSFQKIPIFSRKVGLVFKSLGIFPKVNCSFAFDYLTILMWLRFFRSVAQNVTSRFAVMRSSKGPSKRRMAPISPIPLGDRDVWDLDPKPILERTHDVSFLGSAIGGKFPKFGVTRILGTPKAWSRARMIGVLKNYAETRPTSVVTLQAASTFAASRGADPGPFSELLADTKICVVPRGDLPETYRYFQGLRYGCVIIAEELPDEWFYRGGPAFTIRQWDELPALLDRLLADPELMKRKSAESLAWWHEVVSEPALGRYIAQRVEALGEGISA
ncbi:MAG TPA: hypothetical protein VNT30_08585 [Stellaceae bacterium]|nr:hypothetical protein [Stellaceae bacterium]